MLVLFLLRPAWPLRWIWISLRRILDFVALGLDFVARVTAVASQTAWRPQGRSGVSISATTPMSGASTSISSPAPASRSAGARPRRLASAWPPRTGRGPSSTGLPRWPPRNGRSGERALLGQKGVDQGVDELRLDRGHVAEEHKRARDIGRHGGKPDLAATTRGRSKIPHCEPHSTSRPASAASTDARAWPVTTITGRAWDASAASVAIRTIGLSSSFATSLVAPAPPAGAKARRLARGKHDGADPSHRARAAAGASRSPSAARRRPSRGYPRRGSASRPAPAAGPSRSRSPSATGRTPARR